MDSNLSNNGFNNTNINNSNLNNNPVNVAPAVKKTSKAPLFASVLFGVLAVAGVGFGVFEYLENNKNSSEIKDLKAEIANLKGFKSEKTNVKPTDLNSGNDIENADFTIMDEEVRDVVDEFEVFFMDKIGREPDSYFYDHVYFKNTELKTNTILDKAYSFYYDGSLGLDSDEFEQFNKDVVNKFAALGFEEREDLRLLSDITFENSDGILCTYVSGISCGYKGWIEEETITFVNELAEAYKDVRGDYPFFLNVQDPVIMNSRVEPYQNLAVMEADAVSVYYRESPDAKWKYFTGVQDYAACSDYNTPELKKAFAGDRCYDTANENTEAVVEP